MTHATAHRPSGLARWSTPFAFAVLVAMSSCAGTPEGDATPTDSSQAPSSPAATGTGSAAPTDTAATPTETPSVSPSVEATEPTPVETIGWRQVGEAVYAAIEAEQLDEAEATLEVLWSRYTATESTDPDHAEFTAAIAEAMLTLAQSFAAESNTSRAMYWAERLADFDADNAGAAALLEQLRGMAPADPISDAVGTLTRAIDAASGDQVDAALDLLQQLLPDADPAVRDSVAGLAASAAVLMGRKSLEAKNVDDARRWADRARSFVSDDADLKALDDDIANMPLGPSPTPGPSETEPAQTVDELQARIEKRAADVVQVEAKFEMTTRDVGRPRKEKSTGELWFERDGMIQTTTKQKVGDVTILARLPQEAKGIVGMAWIYDSALNELTVVSPEDLRERNAAGAAGGNPLIDLCERLMSGKKLSDAGEAKLALKPGDVGADGVKVDFYRIKFAPTDAALKAEVKEAEFDIDAVTYYPRRVYLDLILKAEAAPGTPTPFREVVFKEMTIIRQGTTAKRFDFGIPIKKDAKPALKKTFVPEQPWKKSRPEDPPFIVL